MAFRTLSSMKYTNQYKCNRGESGFTLIELMIALFISTFIMVSVVLIYTTQTRNYSNHDDIAAIQQNLRGALLLLPLEIRLAGCDPTESNSARILEATSTRFRFTRDISGGPAGPNDADGDVGGTNEDIAYGYGVDIDTDGDGIVDNDDTNWSGVAALGRGTNGGGMQPLAENIEAIEFNFVLSDGSTSLAPANLNDIRQVQISLLARAANPSQDFVNTLTYTTGSGAVWNPPDDNFKRRLVITNIQLRNMGY